MSHRVCRGIAVWICGLPAWAADPGFRLHLIDAASTQNACAAMDINRDGKLDIIAGNSWYEAPTWRKHFTRDVERIRDRFDDYSHLPWDVNHDGWIDYVSANYRSESIYWVEHPGTPDRPWRKHVVDTPGPMETGRLYDIDGDRQLDLLPNGVVFAAWWELGPPSDGDTTRRPNWIRHDLPPQVAGHGIGFGDINSDGRGDVVGPRGWAEAPVDRRADRWLWHPDFELDRDASIPIVVLDVDRDGDNDLIWGRGHHIGLYWLEQRRRSGTTEWVRHTIDTSWSQPHSLLVADVDRDGQTDIIAGKRYLGHDGKDPGEYDPLVAYWYRFNDPARTWSRHIISETGRAGFGLDPKAVDLDADGDVDVIAADRNGLCWFENRLLDSPVTQAAAAETPSRYRDHTRLMFVADDQSTLRPITSPFDWGRRRADILSGLREAMGPLPEPTARVPLDVRYAESQSLVKYTRQRLSYQAAAGDRVPAYLLVPHHLTARVPAMLCLHQTTNIGKDEPAGLGGLPNLHYAHELAERGYVCLVPDYPSFGEYTYDWRAHSARFASGSMKAIWNNMRAVDLLQSLSEVDRDRIGCIGHSLGGHNGLFTAAFDQRISAIVTSCGFTAFHDYYGGNLMGWTSERYMPRIRTVFQNDPNRVPFDFHEVIAALAPRAVFVNAPLGDDNFDVAGVKKVLAAASEVFEFRSARGKLRVEHPESGHDFPTEIRLAAYTWLDEQLK